MAKAKSLDQARAVVTFLDAASEKTLRSTVALTAARRVLSFPVIIDCLAMHSNGDTQEGVVIVGATRLSTAVDLTSSCAGMSQKGSFELLPHACG